MSGQVLNNSRLLNYISVQKWNLVYCRACCSCFHTDTGSSKRNYYPHKNVVLRSSRSPETLSFKPYIYHIRHRNERSLFNPSPSLNVLSSSPTLPISLSLQLSSILSNTGQDFLPAATGAIKFQNFHTSSSLGKEESKVEKTVKALKDSVKEAEESKAVPDVPEETTLIPAKKNLTQKFIGFVKHYYHGFRLLFIDLKISVKLIWQVLNGKTLSRRENKQLVRTTADMFRLLPMLVFVLVPFAEFLLPVALKLFPDMLPSTFAEEQKEKDKAKKHLKAKLEMAKFLQKTIQESAVQAKNEEGQTVESFAVFLDKIRDQGIKPRTKDIMKFAKLFEDEITLDNLSRQQLRACCIFLGITPLGSDALLRFLLEMKLRRLLADDKMIDKEGVDSLTIAELQSANRARGMRALGVSETRLRDQLQQWLKLHLQEKIPTSLLLLTRALYLPETLSTEEKISVTITQLPETAADEAKVKAAEMTGAKVDNKTKMEIIKREEQIIAAEKEQLELEAKLHEQNLRDTAEAKAAETVMEAHLADPARAFESRPSEIILDVAEDIQSHPIEKFAKDTIDMTSKDFDDMEDVLEKIASERRIDIEKDALKGLKEEVSEYKEDLEDLKDVAVAAESEFSESKAAKRLHKKVERMISRLDAVVDDLQAEKSDIQQKMSDEENILQDELGDIQLSQEQIDLYKTHIISINEMLAAVKGLKNVPDDSKTRRIFEVLDQDKDGIIDIAHAKKVLELLSQEHLKLTASQVDEVIHLLRHETELEAAEREREKLEKEKKEDNGSQEQGHQKN